MITGQNIPESDLVKMLSEKTEPKPEPTIKPIIEEAKIIEKAEPDMADFVQDEPPPKTETATAPTEKGFINDLPAPAAKKPMSISQAEEQAELIIDFVDGADILLLPSAYKKSIFAPGELEKIKILKAKIQNEIKGETTYTSEELELFSKKEDYNELVKNIPFTDDEIKTLKNPLARLIQKKNWEISAEAALISAAMIVMTPRLLPLFNKLERSL